MKKKSLLTIILAFVTFTTATVTTQAQAVYQLPNGGFEQWDNSSLNAEPEHWNSFATSDGSYASMASTPQHYHRFGGRPGTAGSSYLTIYTRSVLGIKANGNMTTGRLHAGAMSATSSENYNYTQTSNSNHCQPFSGTPDSMYFWVSFYAASSSSQAQVSAIIHGIMDFRSPNYENNPAMYCGKASSRFTRTTSSASSMTWQKMEVPFVYDGHSTVNYILVNLTTNYIGGSGSANDSLSIDDIVFIYSAWLNNITVNGIPVADFDKGTFDYTVALNDTAALSSVSVAAVTEADDATTEISITRLTDSTAMAVIDVTAEDSVTTRQYRVTFTAPMPEPTPGPNPTTDTVHYTVIVISSDSTMGTVSPAGESIVDSADSFTVTATAAEGYRFTGWSLDPGYTDIITDNPFTFTVTSDVTVTAHFEVDNMGIDNPVASSTVSIFPNPTTGTVSVEAHGNIELCDLTGRVLQSITVTKPQTIDLSHLPAGIYLLRCGGEVHKIVKQ